MMCALVALTACGTGVKQSVRTPVEMGERIELKTPDPKMGLTINEAHGVIAVAAHSDGYNLFSSLHSLNAFTEELLQVCLVLLVVPRSPSLSVAGVFLMVACHRLMMGSTHHYAHLICRLLVFCIVGIERPAPQGWPPEALRW